MKAKEKNEKDRINKVQNDDKEQEDLDDEDECDSDESSIIRPTSSCMVMTFQINKISTLRKL